MPPLLPLLLAALPILPAPPAERAVADDPVAAARRALARAARGEPAVADLQAAAAERADSSEATRGAVDRGRVAALLPRVTAEFRYDDRSYRVVGLQGSGEVDYAHRAPGWSAAVRATWDLGALVSPPADRAALRGAAERARRRDEAVRKVTALHFERRRLRLSLELDPPATARERAAAELELERLSAEIDALTGGRAAGGGW